MDDQQQVIGQNQSNDLQLKPSVVRPDPPKLIVAAVTCTDDQLGRDRAHHVQGMRTTDLVLPRSSREPDLQPSNFVIQKSAPEGI